MREDQIARLKDLSEKLADVVLEEADPDLWPGAGQPLASLTQQERGDRYWCKRNAAATFSLLERASSTLADATEIGAHGREHDRKELAQEIDTMERQAAKVLERAMKTAKAAGRGA